jgi:hypothetical protein
MARELPIAAAAAQGRRPGQRRRIDRPVVAGGRLLFQLRGAVGCLLAKPEPRRAADELLVEQANWAANGHARPSKTAASDRCFKRFNIAPTQQMFAVVDDRDGADRGAAVLHRVKELDAHFCTVNRVFRSGESRVLLMRQVV